jgi:radical SAM-linked protein
MKKLRVFFAKTGRATYISHLDLSRAMQRAIKRAKLPVWYTEGFNPHIYLTFALPLSLGYSGLCESMDLRLTEDIDEDDFIDRLSAYLPEGLAIIRVAEPVMKPKDIALAHYRMELPVPASAIEALLAQPAILVEKESKRKGPVTIDIKPEIELVSLSQAGEGACAEFMLPAGSQKNLNPALILSALEAHIGPLSSPVHITRMGLFTAERKPFA